MQTLRTADTYGLRPQDYAEGWNSQPSLIPTTDGEARSRFETQFDLALSVAAVQFLTHLHFGRVDPYAAGFNLESPRPPLDLETLLWQLATTDNPGCQQ